MIYRFKNIVISLCGLSIFLLGSCDEPNEVGLEILPADDLLNVAYSDTATLFSYTVKEDSLITTNNSSNMAGAYTDPVFGLSAAGFFAQVTPLKFSPDFGVEPKADSVILSLAYTGFYGDTNLAATEQTFYIYKVSQELNKDSTYYSNTSIGYDQLIGKYKIKPDSKDTILRIKLDTAFFRSYILNQSGQSTLASESAFKSYFKGIYVTPSISTGKPNRILYFALTSAYTRLHIYYSNHTSGSTFHDTSLVYDLAIDNNSARINRFYHNYAGTPIAAQLLDSSLGATQVYLQGMAGVKTKVRMPYLKNYLNIGKIAVNKAELIMTTDPNSVQSYLPASEIAIRGIDSIGKSYLTADFYESYGEYFVYNTTTGEYKVNITRYVQQVLTGKTTDNGLFLILRGGSVLSNRTILQGAGPVNAGKIKLQITYSLLN